MSFATGLTRLLGIDCPILQAGMAGFAGPELAIAVSNAGGLGILAGHGIGPEELREGLGRMRQGTARPFGVNLLLAEDLVHPVEAAAIDSGFLEGVHERLNPLRRAVGLADAFGLPEPPIRNVEEKLEIVLAAKVQVLSIGLGDPGHELVERCHRLGTRVVAMVATVADAKEVALSGVDALVVQGGEAGGHRSHFEKPDNAAYGAVGSMALIPEIADLQTGVPIIAAGGICDGRGLVAAMALGAEAVMMGTRFLATQESLAVRSYKQALVDGLGEDTYITDVASGRYARLLRNRFTTGYGEEPVLPFGWQGSATGEIFERARELDDPEYMALWAGQSVGGIHEVMSAGEVVRAVMREAREVVAKLRMLSPEN